MVDGTNREQIEFWNSDRASSWVREQEARDRALLPFGEAALTAAGPRRDEQVVDIGCGCGATSLALAAAVGTGGAVLGVDVSDQMLARAKERSRGVSQLRFANADAATFAFEPKAQLVFSRFGVMFFDDPGAAFTNLRRALATDGRLAFVCWRGLADNAWMEVPYRAVLHAVPNGRPKPAANAPGPLAFADPSHVRTVLTQSGFSAISFAPFGRPMPLGQGQGLKAAALEAISLGPAARHLAEADEPARARALQAVERALTPFAVGDTVELAGAAWIVTARPKTSASTKTRQ